jgi:hypothetical protein
MALAGEDDWCILNRNFDGGFDTKSVTEQVKERQNSGETLKNRSNVIEKCLNHTEENRMIKTYQQAKLIGPMTEAWNLWAGRLDLLSSIAKGESSNVKTLRSA